MAILYYDEKKLFQLNTEEYDVCDRPEPGRLRRDMFTTDPFCTESRICIRSAWMSRRSPPSVNKREKSSFLDRFPMEYPTGGVGDYRESCLNIRNAQGRMGCEIFFDSYEIFKGKRPLTGLPASFGTEDEVETLEITCKDPVLDLVVVLSYSVFTKRKRYHPKCPREK